MSIWKYNQKPKIKKAFQLTLNEGNTPCETCQVLADQLELTNLYIKREDKNPTGSFKDRSLAYQLSHYHQKGNTKFVISSSGNAAIASAAYSRLFPSTLNIFISNKIPNSKKKRLFQELGIKREIYSKKITKGNITIRFSKRPKSDAIKFSRSNDAILLRGSKDQTATIGFETIAPELEKQAPDADSIFIPCSSGTSTVGIYNGFKKLSSNIPQIHIVQTKKVHPIAKEFDTESDKTKRSYASAIVDRVAHRKETVVEIIKSTNGFGWIICDSRLLQSKALLQKHCNISVSYDAALSLAGVIKAKENDFPFKKPVIILSGI